MHLWNLKKADWEAFKKNSQYFITDGLIDDNNSETFKNIVDSFTSLANETLHCKKKNKNNAKSNNKQRPIPFGNIKCIEAIYKIKVFTRLFRIYTSGGNCKGNPNIRSKKPVGKILL